MDLILRNILILGTMMIFIIVASQACLPTSCSPPKKLKTTPFPRPPKVNRTVVEPNIRAGRRSLECVFTYKSFWDDKWVNLQFHHGWMKTDATSDVDEFRKCTYEVVDETYEYLKRHGLNGMTHFPGWYKRKAPPENAQYRCVTYFLIRGYYLNKTSPWEHQDREYFDNGSWHWVNHTTKWHHVQHSYLIRGCLYDKIMFGTDQRRIHDAKVYACATCATDRCNNYYYILKPDPKLDKYKDQYNHSQYFPQVSKEHQEQVDKYVKRNPIVYTAESYLADAGKRGRRTRALQANNRKWFARPEIIDSDYVQEEPEEEDTRVLVNIEKFLFNYFKIKRPDKTIEKRMETVMQCTWETL